MATMSYGYFFFKYAICNLLNFKILLVSLVDKDYISWLEICVTRLYITSIVLLYLHKLWFNVVLRNT